MVNLYLNGTPQPLVIGKTLFECFEKSGHRLPGSCQGRGVCRECLVEVKSGMEALDCRTSQEKFLAGGYRLGCQAKIMADNQDIEVVALRRGQAQILMETEPIHTKFAPHVTRVDGQVVLQGNPIDEYRGHIYGIAVDVGTTTVCVHLVDLETGALVGRSAFENPQGIGGSNVIARIGYDGGEFSGHLQQLLMQALNRAIADLVEDPSLIYEVTIAGNSTMRDLAFGLDVQPIGQLPFKSLTELEWESHHRSSTALLCPAVSIALQAHPYALVYGLPLIGCHVGADTAACLQTIKAYDQKGPLMVVDIGTNTEVVVIANGRTLAASCPAGPALEGAGVHSGMPALEGAIQSVVLNHDTAPQYNVIGDGEPMGVCGSGFVDLLAGLLRTGRLGATGRFEQDTGGWFNLVDGHRIGVGEHDISLLAQAKAANFAGMHILLNHLGLVPDDLQTLYLAGGFANYVNIDNAVRIGLLPNIPTDRFRKVGNASLQGATELLVNHHARACLESFVANIEHVELEADPDYFNFFVEGCLFEV